MALLLSLAVHQNIAGYKEPILLSSSCPHPANVNIKRPTRLQAQIFFSGLPRARCVVRLPAPEAKHEIRLSSALHSLRISLFSGKYIDSDGIRLPSYIHGFHGLRRPPVCTNTSGVARRSSQFRSSDDCLIAKRKLKCCKQNTIIRYSKWTSGYQGKGMLS